jgi:hypothetical protein
MKKPHANDGVQPDSMELVIRFVCGAVVGGLACAWAMMRVGKSLELAAVGALVGGVVSGLLARQYGDRFWL